jgi:hypothetical protein
MASPPTEVCAWGHVFVRQKASVIERTAGIILGFMEGTLLEHIEWSIVVQVRFGATGQKYISTCFDAPGIVLDGRG